MATIDTLTEPKLGEPGESCAECGSPLAADQRYCLECGTRRGDPRLEYAKFLKNGSNGADGPPGGPTGSGAKQPGSGRDWTPFLLVGLVAGLGIMLAIGVLIGKGGSGDQATPQVVQVGGTADTGTGTGSGSDLPTADTQFKSDWPSGKDGYTVEIGSLAKQGTTAEQVDAAKSEASDKGAPDVGALDSDDYGSLPSGNYVIYSGVYDTKADATKALKPLKSDYPDAKVVQVSAKGGGSAGGGGKTVSANSADDLTNNANTKGTVTASSQALKDLNSKSGEAYSDASRKLPDTISTGGKPPPTDSKEPGAGSPVTVIK